MIRRSVKNQVLYLISKYAQLWLKKHFFLQMKKIFMVSIPFYEQINYG